MLMIHPPPRRFRCGSAAAAAVEDAAEVRVDDVLPVAGGHVGDVREMSDAGVVHEDVEAAEPLDRGVDCAAGFVRLPDVGPHREHRICREPRGGRVEVLLIAARDDHSGALATKAAAIASPMPRDPPVTMATVDASAGRVEV